MDISSCEMCAAPLDPVYRNLFIEIGPTGLAASHTLCFLCYAMCSAASTPYFERLEMEEYHYRQKIKHLKPGADYFG